MSEHFTVVIPSDPSAPLPDTAEVLRAALQRLAGGDASRVKDYRKLQFIDCGDTPCRIGCPHCDADVPQTVWQAWMTENWHAEDGFHLHSHPAPCCKSPITLTTLIYEPKQGFATWMISARSAAGRTLTSGEMEELQGLAGIKLTAINQIYRDQG
ncbi:MAG: hypothetical protein AAGA06_02815 [Pseudomonadota bacterium]